MHKKTKASMRFHSFCTWILPILVIAILAPFTPKLDLFFARAAHFGDGLFFNPLLFQFLYNYGEIFSLLLGAVCLIIVIASFSKKILFEYRKPCLAFLLTLVIGAGLITNVFFKGYWGRPRPKQLIEFGGRYDYRPYFKPNFSPSEKQKSFPSGHVAMGFSFISFVLSFRRMGKKGLYYLSIVLTILLGGGLTVARVAQGGHFFSDVTFSLALIWLVANLADRFVFRSRFLHR